MTDEIAQKVQPIYKELQGYLAQTPTAQQVYWNLNSSYWNQFHDCIEQLNKITGEDYSRFRVTLLPPTGNTPERIETYEYRTKLNGLIMNLKGKYFPEQSDPFGGSPSVVVSQTQNTQITMLMDFQSLIDKRLYGGNLKSEEKTFLEKVKAALPTVKSVAEITGLVIKMANDSGLDLHSVAKIFGWT